MAKKTPLDTDVARLKTKMREKRSGAESLQGDTSMRALHKRLKRAQRKQRRLVTRKQRGMGKAGAAQKTETAGA